MIYQPSGRDISASEANFMNKDIDQTKVALRKFKLGHLGNLNQVTKGLAKTIRAMADGTLDSQVGARICNGLGIMRACLETQKLEQLEARMGEISRLLGARTVASSPLSVDHETPLSINHETNGPSH
jgi:hypothetical protein